MRYTIYMVIGIDVSQSVYTGTGVGKYVREMTKALVQQAPEHTYVLFGSSLRQQQALIAFGNEVKAYAKNVYVKIFPLPPTILDILWNKLHILPIHWFIGHVDVFWSSDWTQPPLGNTTIGLTTIHDVSFLRFPESFHKTIVAVQRRRLARAKKECRLFLCDSEATKQDVKRLLHISDNQLVVIYPGYR